MPTIQISAADSPAIPYTCYRMERPEHPIALIAEKVAGFYRPQMISATAAAVIVVATGNTNLFKQLLDGCLTNAVNIVNHVGLLGIGTKTVRAWRTVCAGEDQAVNGNEHIPPAFINVVHSSYTDSQ
jgi:hypothetical protein